MTTAALLDSASGLPLDVPFTTAQAHDCGTTPRQLTGLVRRGYLRRPLKGVYVAAQVPDDLATRAQVLRLVVPPGGVVTDRTAGWLHGATMVLEPGAHLVIPRVSVFMETPGLRLRNGLVRSGERTLEPGDVVEVEGLRATTALRTACDLGRLLHRDSAIAALDSLLRLGHFSHEELVAEVRRFRGYRGVVQLRWLAPLADARHESFGESALGLRWVCCPLLPPSRPQLVVPGPRGFDYRIDRGVEELLLGVEYDGEEFHGEEQRQHDEARREYLEQEYGFTFVVCRREHVFGPRESATSMLVHGVADARATLGERRVRARRALAA